MAARASIAGHPIHPMLVTIPIGLWVFSFICDLISLAGALSPVWPEMAFYTLAGGIVGALLAAVPGALDLFAMTDPKTKRIGLVHMALNLSVTVMMLVNLWLRTRLPPGSTEPVWLSAAAVGLLAVSGWLGGEMVYIRGAAVQSPPKDASNDRRM